MKISDVHLIAASECRTLKHSKVKGVQGAKIQSRHVKDTNNLRKTIRVTPTEGKTTTHKLS